MVELVYHEFPVVTIRKTTFFNVPVIMQYRDQPVLEFVRGIDASFTTCIPIFHSDGTYLAKIKGTQLYSTKQGDKAGVKLRKFARSTVCELKGQTILELHREAAVALKLKAELHTCDGSLLKWSGYQSLRDNTLDAVLDDPRFEAYTRTFGDTNVKMYERQRGIWITERGVTLGSRYKITDFPNGHVCDCPRCGITGLSNSTDRGVEYYVCGNYDCGHIWHKPI